MDDAVALLSKLKTTEPLQQQERIVSQLVQLICELNEDDDDNENDEVQEAFLQNENINLVFSHLQEVESEENVALLVSSAQLMAELAKTESLREPLVKKGVMPHLLRHLNSKKIALATQACRALGNICYDNDPGRVVVDKENGIQVILNVLSKQISNTEDGAARLLIIVCGFLLNLTNNCELLQNRAIEANVLEHLNECISSHIDDEDLTNMALLTIGSITESDSGKVAATKSGLLDTFKTLLDKSGGEHLKEMIVDLLSTLTESEAAKDRAADNGLSQSLVDIVQSDSHTPELTKLASDVLVSLLVGDTSRNDFGSEFQIMTKGNVYIHCHDSDVVKTHAESELLLFYQGHEKLAGGLERPSRIIVDASMEKLYASGDGSLFLQSVEWLSSKKDSLKSLGTLAIGNFARRDAYCQQLVEKGIVEKLVTILKANLGPESSFTLQHAVLSTLRNLAIPTTNKPRLLEAGAMDACLALIHTEVMAVVFKLLGVLRMLIEGQEAAATKLGQERAFLECLSDWCGVEAHAGVKGEATRVMASLVKNSRSSAVIQNLIRAEGLNHLVSMATSEHRVMQNEALMALTIICSTALGEAAVALKEADLTETVLMLLKDESLPPEMVCNVLSLLKAICTAGNLQEEIIASGVIDLVRSIAETNTDDRVKDTAKATVLSLEQSMACT